METIGRLKERIEQGYRLGYDEALELLRTTPETELCALAPVCLLFAARVGITEL